MSAMQAEISEAFRAIDVPEDKALRAAASTARALASEASPASTPRPADPAVFEAHVATPKAGVAGSKNGLTGVEGELALLKWTMSFGLALLVAITAKLFPR